jgi:hypothetical protein
MMWTFLLLALTLTSSTADYVCTDLPIPSRPGGSIGELIKHEQMFFNAEQARPAVGLVLPATAQPNFERSPPWTRKDGSVAPPLTPPDASAVAVLMARLRLRVGEKQRTSSRRATAVAAASGISAQLEELLDEPGPLAPTIRRWAETEENQRISQIAGDLEGLVPELGWHAVRGTAGTTFAQISVTAEISPLRLSPLVSTVMLTDRWLVPRAVAIRVPDSGGFTTWYVESPRPHEAVVLRRIWFQGHTSFDVYAVCREKN